MSKSDDLKTRYQALRPQYEAFTTSLHGLIASLLQARQIEYFSIEPRTKSQESFDEKIQREDKEEKYDSVEGITDLTGVRIIAYLQEECVAIGYLIRDNFVVDEANSSNKEDELDPDKFGYLSSHYVLSLGENRIELDEFRPYAALKAEVQVRTLLQHTWASIDWKFRYKGEREAPKSLRRRLFRISALLEAADNEFSAVKAEIESLRLEYEKGIDSGNLGIPINNESVKTYISTSKSAQTVLGIAKNAGLRVIASTLDQGAINRLVSTAGIMGLESLKELDDVIIKLVPKAKRFWLFAIDRLLTIREGSIPQLIEPAVIRYSLMLEASSAKRKEINRKHKPTAGYAEALAEFTP